MAAVWPRFRHCIDERHTILPSEIMKPSDATLTAGVVAIMPMVGLEDPFADHTGGESRAVESALFNREAGVRSPNSR